ncbi:N-acetyltransferase family protein [Dietzia sp. DQ12-45-1b]|uniref:GNAT family N-acetyltransferase n=2 Tax=Dietzia TaxID=37914 RepID=UPI001315D2A1|nr:GCN5-related N-acetyltransferase [Dietzia sp. DQ12-45-1b]
MAAMVLRVDSSRNRRARSEGAVDVTGESTLDTGAGGHTSDLLPGSCARDPAVTNTVGMRTRHVSTVIHRSPAEVYVVASDHTTLASWASGLATAEAAVDGDSLIVDSPMGRVTVRFVPKNDFGILDHEVTLPDGNTVYNPLRVVPHPDGAEVIMSVRQLTDDDDAFEHDAATVAADLNRLKGLLEADRPPLPSSAPGLALPADIRVAGPSDAASLGRLLHAFNTEFDCPTPSPAEAAGRFERLLGREDVLAVVARLTHGREAGTDVGFAFLTLRPTPYWDGPLAQLEDLYVRPDLRAAGVGTAMLDRSVSEARRRGCEEMLINVDADDLGARRFYERHGFSDVDPDTGSGMRCYLRGLRAVGGSPGEVRSPVSR